MNKTEDDYTKGYGDGLNDAYDYWKRNGKLPEPASNTASMQISIAAWKKVVEAGCPWICFITWYF
jgi:hypothetical protein